MERCCYSLGALKLSSGANQKKKEKDQEIFKKIIEQGVYNNLLQEMRVNDRELYFRLFL